MNFNNEKALNVYRSSSSGAFVVSFNGEKNKELRLIVSSLLGQVFYTKEFVITDNFFIQFVDLSEKLTLGIYTGTVLNAH